MPGYFAALTIVFLIGMVVIRARLMKRAGIQAVHFGKIDKTDFLIPPFMFFYFYLIFAAAFNLPNVSNQLFFDSFIASWLGVILCLTSLILFLWSLISFGDSFRVGIDENFSDKLVTTGAFAYSRNPIYVAFGLILLGQFLIFPNWILLVYLGGAIWLFHRQILREEDFLKEHFRQEFTAYCERVRRYI